jgi:ABC-type spermidine/putrescine transport system permease subunit I
MLNTVGAVWFLMVYCYLPFMILPIYTSLEKFDTRLCEASFDLGGTWWQTVWRIIIPISWSGIRSGFFLVLVPAFGEFAIPELIGGDRVMFVGSVVTAYTVRAETAQLGAAFTLLSSLVLLLIVGLLYGCDYKFFKRKI